MSVEAVVLAIDNLKTRISSLASAGARYLVGGAPTPTPVLRSGVVYIAGITRSAASPTLRTSPLAGPNIITMDGQGVYTFPAADIVASTNLFGPTLWIALGYQAGVGDLFYVDVSAMVTYSYHASNGVVSYRHTPVRYKGWLSPHPTQLDRLYVPAPVIAGSTGLNPNPGGCTVNTTTLTAAEMVTAYASLDYSDPWLWMVGSPMQTSSTGTVKTEAFTPIAQSAPIVRRLPLN